MADWVKAAHDREGFVLGVGARLIVIPRNAVSSVWGQLHQFGRRISFQQSDEQKRYVKR